MAPRALGRSSWLRDVVLLAALSGASVTASAQTCPTAEQYAKTKVDRVTAVFRSDAASKRPDDKGQPATDVRPLVQLRDQISVHVNDLKTLLEREKCSTTHGKIVLFLDGRPIPTVTPFPPADPSTGSLQFVLERKEATRDAWTHLLGKPSYQDRPVEVSVGIQDEHPIASDQTLLLRSIPRLWFWIWAIIFLLLVFAFWLLATRSDVLRDTGPQPTGAQRKPYSLAKMQAAWWFFLILASYLFIGLISGDYSTTITSTVLSLMGISAATALGSATIDAGRAQATAPAAAAAPADGVARTPPATRGHWWLDILSDENGVNFHRFQMAAWTAVLGVIFIHDVYVGLAMPNFDNTLLGLLGISAGTYLGLKTTSEMKPK